MEPPVHRLPDHFRQLGLPGDPTSIERFIAQQRPLAANTALWDAPFWSTSQAQFLREAVAEDADWAELVDQLASLLSAWRAALPAPRTVQPCQTHFLGGAAVQRGGLQSRRSA